MRNTIRGLAAAGAVMMFLTACASATHEDAHDKTVLYYADYPSYNDLRELAAGANLIVEGTVTGTPRILKQAADAPSGTDPQLNPQAGAPAGAQPAPEPMISTVHTFQISKVFKGKATTGQSIEVKEIGGVLDGVTYKNADATPLAAGTKYTLFLQTYPDSPASLLNPQQGKYPVDAAGNLSALPGNPVQVARADLEKLATTK